MLKRIIQPSAQLVAFVLLLRKLIRFIRRQGWHVICALKGNRKLNGIRVDGWEQRLRHKRYTRVRVPAADGTTRTYWVRVVTGRLSLVRQPLAPGSRLLC